MVRALRLVALGLFLGLAAAADSGWEAAGTCQAGDAGCASGAPDGAVVGSSILQVDNTKDRVQQGDLVPAVDLGSAGIYVILTKTGTSTVPNSLITGNIGVSPAAGTYMTGFSFTADKTAEFSSSEQIIGEAYAATDLGDTPALLTTAVDDMQIAYTDASSRANTKGVNLLSGHIGGETLAPGVYTFDKDINIGSDITFHGSATDIFILQTTGNLMQVDHAKVILSGSAQAKNIFWQVAGRVLVGKEAVMKGILLVKTKVVFQTKSVLIGRILAQTHCALQMATITEP